MSGELAFTGMGSAVLMVGALFTAAGGAMVSASRGLKRRFRRKNIDA